MELLMATNQRPMPMANQWLTQTAGFKRRRLREEHLEQAL